MEENRIYDKMKRQVYDQQTPKKEEYKLQEQRITTQNKWGKILFLNKRKHIY